MGWTRSDVIAAGAAALALLSLSTQWNSRGDAARLQAHVDRTQAASQIINAAEQVISTRQAIMVQVSSNYYRPEWAKKTKKEVLIEDGKAASPILAAVGAFQGAVQNNVRFYQDKSTLEAIAKLDEELIKSVACFTNIASAGHRLDGRVFSIQLDRVVQSCPNQNDHYSLDQVKLAEAQASYAMDQESATGHPQDTPKLRLSSLF